MPGAFAHITLVNLMKETRHLAALGFSNPASAALLDYFGYCELGAVSPDYPYLSIGEGASASWADHMHYLKTGDVVQAIAEGVRSLGGEPRRRAFAWLLGYAAHVATDVTIHPVVELKVGPYAQNKTAHRVCEMHQDSYIFAKHLNLGEVGLSEHLASGILRCVEPGQGGVVNGAIKGVWEGALRKIHPEEADRNPPRVDHWHQRFGLMVDKIGEEGNRLMPIARHVAVNCGLTYPALGDVNHAEYITALRVPGDRTQSYDAIFERAIESVGKAWVALHRAVFDNDGTAAAFFGRWDLDTGRDPNGKLVFWA
jgi:hypothetical protein